MKTGHTPDSLRAFERQIADDFNAGKIRAPVHLAGGCEEDLIRIFEGVQPQDWVLVQWRSHYECLLKGVSPERLRRDILAGHSITLCYPDYRILSSAIVGGILPIGTGLAMAVKRRGGTEKVWCFVGDMTGASGMYWECVRYAHGHGLPMRFVIADNGLSVCTPTKETWGEDRNPNSDIYVEYFQYKLPWPHSGAGVRVNF